MTVCVLLLWLGSRTVSHVAWAPTEHCRLEPTCAEHRDWRAAWCGTRRIRHYTATGKFTRQASKRTGRLNEIRSSRSSQARETAGFNSTTPLRWRHQLRIPNGAADSFGASEEEHAGTALEASAGASCLVIWCSRQFSSYDILGLSRVSLQIRHFHGDRIT